MIKDDVVQEVLRLTDDLRVERLSLKDGLVMGSANLGIASLSFAVSDRAGKVYLVADGSGQVVLWNTDSDERTVLRSTAVGAESVAFAPVSGYGEGRRVLAIAETDGTVALWDLSGGLADLREPLAQLITFEDGDWAVVGADGRYDASDPADFDGSRLGDAGRTDRAGTAVGILPRLLRAAVIAAAAGWRIIRGDPVNRGLWTANSRALRSPAWSLPGRVG